MEKDKLNFAKNCRRIEEDIKNRKKNVKGLALSLGIPFIFAILYSILNPWVAILYFIFASALFGIVCVTAHYYNRRDIDNCNIKNANQFTYTDYKQMKKSGELERLYKQIEEMQNQEATEMYSQYLDFVKGKTYTPVKTTDKKIENQYEFVEKENNNNL